MSGGGDPRLDVDADDETVPPVRKRATRKSATPRKRVTKKAAVRHERRARVGRAHRARAARSGQHPPRWPQCPSPRAEAGLEDDLEAVEDERRGRARASPASSRARSDAEVRPMVPSFSVLFQAPDTEAALTAPTAAVAARRRRPRQCPRALRRDRTSSEPEAQAGEARRGGDRRRGCDRRAGRAAAGAARDDAVVPPVRATRRGRTTRTRPRRTVVRRRPTKDARTTTPARTRPGRRGRSRGRGRRGDRGRGGRLDSAPPSSAPSGLRRR